MFHYKSIYSIKPTAVTWLSFKVRYAKVGKKPKMTKSKSDKV